MPRTRTGRSRLEHRHGWLDAVWHGAAHFAISFHSLAWLRKKSLWVAAKRQPKGFNIKGKVSFMSSTLQRIFLPDHLKWKNTSVRASELNLQQ
ncbi:MAG TPA: hypothetical protein VMW91_04395 [Desulfosporosinus sp.]|nr:hypothetical protein [Desulfosporosinus sp.]